MTYPEGLIKSYGSCSRHVLGISIFPVGKNYFPSWKKDFPRHKKSLRLKAIGETVALPDSLLSSFKRWQRYEEYLEPPNIFGKKLW
jgi:hypothetical protein